MSKAKTFRALCFLAACAAASAVSAAAPAIQPGSWTLAILPDIQNYTWLYPAVLNSQTQFLADNRESLNLKYVLQEGDVTQHNTTAQWSNAQAGFQILDQAGIPYSIAPGNHDYGPNGDASERRTNMPAAFPVMKLQQQPTFGGVYPGESNSPCNSYSLFSAGGTDWLVLALEFGPRDPVVDWADSVLKQYPNRQAMIVTHSYLYSDDTRYDWAAKGSSQAWSPYSTGLASLPGGVNDGQQMWDKLQDNTNLQFIFCGHVLNDMTGYLASEADGGNIVHQILANYQTYPNGGNGYMRLLEFLPDGRTVHVRTYSPYLDASLTGAEQDFFITMTQVRVPEPEGFVLLLGMAACGFLWKARGRFARRFRGP